MKKRLIAISSKLRNSRYLQIGVASLTIAIVCACVDKSKEDSMISPLIGSSFYQAICNRDRIFSASGGLTKISGDYCLYDSTGNYILLKNKNVQ